MEVLRVEHLSKSYYAGTMDGKRLLDALRHPFAPKQEKTIHALRDVSFQLQQGDRVGLLGPNGAGKSTLLKILSRLTQADKGTVAYNGRLSAMLDVGTGFHNELTGRENLELHGALMGMTRDEMEQKMEQIISFSELQEFLDTPIKRYSAGMNTRLSFSVLAFLDADILLLDEALAVGDVGFQEKCIQKMNQLSQDEERTIVYISHNMQSIRSLCNRVLVLSEGKLIYDGPVEEGISCYLEVAKEGPEGEAADD